MRHWRKRSSGSNLQLFCSDAAVSEDHSCLVWLDSAARARLGLFGGSVQPLCRVYDRLQELGLNTEAGIDALGAPAVAALQKRIKELGAMTKAALTKLLESSWGEAVTADDFTKNALVEKVLAHEGRWVNLDAST